MRRIVSTLAFLGLLVLFARLPLPALGQEKTPARQEPTLTLQKGHADIAYTMSVSKDGKWLVTAGHDGTPTLWETATGRHLQRPSRLHQRHGLFRRRQIAFEEPENGVHSRRLELIADLLTSLSLQQGRQVIVTTHSASFCNAILKKRRAAPSEIAMLNVRRSLTGTEVAPFGESAESLFKDVELAAALTAPAEDGLFEALLLRGLVDE